LNAVTAIFEEEYNDSAVASASFEENLTRDAMATLSSLDVVSWQDVLESTTNNPVMQMLSNVNIDGFPPQKQQLPEQLRSFFAFREDLSLLEGVVMYRDRIVIPPNLRPRILSTLHSAHQGVTSMTSRAQSSIFWPGITADLEFSRETCSPCDRIAPSQPMQPPTPSPDPVYPFQQICGDYFKYSGYNYLVVVDRYSGWPMAYKLSGGSPSLVKKLREMFVTFGIPEELASDGGPEFIASESTTFLRSWGVSHRLSSVAYPHSNCRAEVGVKTVKRMIMDNTGPNGEIDIPKFQRAMLQYRNTPSSLDKRSPAEIVFGHQIRDFIPVKPGKYIPYHTWTSTAENREIAFQQRHAKEVERLSEHTKKLPALKVGDHVRVQNQTGPAPLRWDRTGDVIEVRQHDQYAVKVHGSGRVTLRNRKFLRKYVPFVAALPPASIAQDILRTHQQILPAASNKQDQPSIAAPSLAVSPQSITPSDNVHTHSNVSENIANPPPPSHIEGDSVRDTGSGTMNTVPMPVNETTTPTKQTSVPPRNDRPRRITKAPPHLADYVVSKK
jgi:hypothetical protein